MRPGEDGAARRLLSNRPDWRFRSGESDVEQSARRPRGPRRACSPRGAQDYRPRGRGREPSGILRRALAPGAQRRSPACSTSTTSPVVRSGNQGTSRGQTRRARPRDVRAEAMRNDGLTARCAPSRRRDRHEISASTRPSTFLWKALGGEEVAVKSELPIPAIQPRWLPVVAAGGGCRQVIEIAGLMTWGATWTATRSGVAARACVGVGRSRCGCFGHSRRGLLWAALASARDRLHGRRCPLLWWGVPVRNAMRLLRTDVPAPTGR